MATFAANQSVLSRLSLVLEAKTPIWGDQCESPEGRLTAFFFFFKHERAPKMYKTKLKALRQGQTTQTVNEVQLENSDKKQKQPPEEKRFPLTICISIPISLWQ